MWPGQQLITKLIKLTVVIINWLQLIAEVSCTSHSTLWQAIAHQKCQKHYTAIQPIRALGRTSATWSISTEHPRSSTDQLMCFKLYLWSPKEVNHSLPSLCFQIFRFPVCRHTSLFFPATKEHQYSVFPYTSACSYQAVLAALSSQR